MDRTPPTGARGEQLAAEHLLRLGYRILARNVRTRAGEIDLVALDGGTLVFAEVKTRRLQPRRAADTQALVEPLSGLRPAQRARLRRLAAAWLVAGRPAGTRARLIRFDAIGVVLDRRGRLLALEHLRGAW